MSWRTVSLGVVASAVGLGVPLWIWWSRRMDDSEWIARLLTAEAGDLYRKIQEGDPDAEAEWAGIAWVARNRARRWDMSVEQIALTSERGKVWNRGTSWSAKLAKASDSPAWSTAQAFARRVQLGAVANPIGPRTLFVHTATQRALGRSLPSWIVSTSAGGRAPNEPIRLGRATFA